MPAPTAGRGSLGDTLIVMSTDQSAPTPLTPTHRWVAVVGGGITGLVAAYELLRRDPSLQVTILEASERLGGQIRAIDAAGVRLDVGAEAIHLGTPAAARLVQELGLAPTIVGSRPGTSLLLTRRGLVPLPAGVGPAGPTSIKPVLDSGILSPAGLARAGLEPLKCHKHPADISVGDFVNQRFGHEVVDAFVDPLLGNLHSGDVYQLGLHATAKSLRPAASKGASLLVKAMRKPKRRPASDGPHYPMFASWPRGLEELVGALAASLQGRAAIRLNTQVTSIARAHHGFTLETAQGALAADAVIVATGPAASASLLARLSAATATAMMAVPTASVATVVLGYDRDAAAANTALRESNGLLLNQHQSHVLKAMTNMARKWPMCDAATCHLIRVSVGRAGSTVADELDDADMIAAVIRELADLLDLRATPQFAQVARWPHAMPQLGVGHVERIAAARAELETVGAIQIAGAPVDGLGLSSTIASGAAAAERLTPTLA